MEKEYNKAYAVGEYVKGLSNGLSTMFGTKESENYYFSSGYKGVGRRKDLVDAVHDKCIEAINLLKD